jgi:M6 family metalloprotease-like protein
MSAATRLHTLGSRLVVMTAALGLACGGTGSDAPPTTPTRTLTSISVSLPSTVLQVGQSTTATAGGLDQTGATMALGAVTWSSGSDNVATVNASGVVTGRGAGQTTITATSGGKSGTAPVTVVAGDALAACRLPSSFTGVGLGFPRSANRLRTVGDVRATVLFTDFSDAPAARTPQSAFGVISPAAENYYTAVSYGKMNLILQPNFVWLRMSKPSTGYGWSGLTFAAHKAYIQEAINLAGSSVNYSASDAIVVISNPDAGALTNGPAFVPNPGDGVTAGGKLLESGATSGRDLLGWGAFWLNHEMGHTMGLPDLYAFSNPAHRFVGMYSLMGLISGPAREYFAWERWYVGWLTDDQVICAPAGTTTATLTPVERSGGTKMVVVPTGTRTAIVVESRRIEGYDSGFAAGLLVYVIDASIASGNGVVKVLPINEADSNKSGVTLGVGASLTFGGVTVTFVSQDGSGDRVRVTR